MNIRAKDLGLTKTFFVNESGLDVDKVSGGYGSANDVNELMKFIIKTHPEILEATKYQNISFDSSDITFLAGSNISTFLISASASVSTNLSRAISQFSLYTH